MFLSLLTIDKGLNEELSEEDTKRNLEQLKQQEDREKIQQWSYEEVKEEDQDFMSYKEICSLCKGNGYITVVVKGEDEIKQCWLCESKGEKRYSQAEVDEFIYNMYYKKGGTHAI